MKKNTEYDAVIIGGGFYGCLIAEFLKRKFHRVALLEKEDGLLKRASYANQARIHNGYHYPRSLLTATRSRVNFPKFVRDFRSAVDKDFTKIYAISKIASKVNSDQFVKFCKRINAPIKPASDKIQGLFNKDFIEEAFVVKEYAFNALGLRSIVRKRLNSSNVKIFFKTNVRKVTQKDKDQLLVHTASGKTFCTKLLFNCTYTNINSILKESGLPIIDFRHEVTEMAIIKIPDHLKKFGVTVMDGPFFSVMPFPSLKTHSLSHVRYTPHSSWSDKKEYKNPDMLRGFKLKSNFPFMIRDAARFIPSLSGAKYLSSIYEFKTLLPINEIDDGRPILFKKDYGFKNFYIVMGGKIDNIFDVLQVLSASFKKG